MASFEFEGKTFETDNEGFILNRDDWNENLAGHIAKEDGISLTENHWEIINYLRKFYKEFGISPMVKLLIKHLKQEKGEATADREYLYGLFPKGPAKQGSKIAGLPKPPGCID